MFVVLTACVLYCIVLANNTEWSMECLISFILGALTMHFEEISIRFIHLSTTEIYSIKFSTLVALTPPPTPQHHPLPKKKGFFFFFLKLF